MFNPLDFCSGMSRPETGTVTKTFDKTCGKHVSRPCDLAFALVFPSSRFRLRYFVFSALEFGEFKRFHDSIYRSLRELFLFILYVNEHDSASP